jgi:hypothetical protein
MPSNTGGTKKELGHEELRAALHVHTLARILYAHIVAARPWPMPPSENTFGSSWEAAPPVFTPGPQGFWPH